MIFGKANSMLVYFPDVTVRPKTKNGSITQTLQRAHRTLILGPLGLCLPKTYRAFISPNSYPIHISTHIVNQTAGYPGYKE